MHQWVELKTVNTYHLLEGTLGEGIAIPQVIDLNVLDVVASLGVDIAIDGRGRFLNGHGHLHQRGQTKRKMDEIRGRELTAWTAGTLGSFKFG